MVGMDFPLATENAILESVLNGEESSSSLPGDSIIGRFSYLGVPFDKVVWNVFLVNGDCRDYFLILSS
jgi:hypothetical protein